MIKTINITGLFGRFNYSIDTMPDGITIITGPNGFGKSTILQIINALSTGDLAYLLKLEFKKIVVLFNNTKSTTIEKNNNTISIDGTDFRLTKDLYESYLQFKQRPWIIETADGYFDRRSDENFTEAELFRQFMAYNDDWITINRVSNKSPKNAHSSLKSITRKLDWIKQQCGDIGVISDQRLLKKKRSARDDQQVIDVISELPGRLKAQISHVYNQYSDTATSLDSTYPKRLFTAKDDIKDQEEYEHYLNEANRKFSKLCQYNLVDMTIIDQKEYNAKHATALKIYFDDFAEKYTVFEVLISKLDLFTRIINTRLRFKKIIISREKGFCIVDIDNPRKELNLSQLSSGEKQEIVLFYELIFGNKEKRLLLIDEPEISLHIAWQKHFLDDLLEVAKYTNIQAIVATHSPQIVSNHWDIQIDLGELYAEQLNKNQPQ